MSFRDDKEIYLSIANDPKLTQQQKEDKIEEEFYNREQNFNMSKVEKFARWLQEETKLDFSAERLWAIANK